MQTLLLIDGKATPRQMPDTLTAFWNENTDTALSIPAELDHRLPALRAELLKWVYETGHASIYGQELEKHLRAGDSLSMWWCSTLAEKHPKVTHNLFEALKLRVLEQILDENGIRQLVLLSGENIMPPWGKTDTLAKTLRQFCTATDRSFCQIKEKKNILHTLLAILHRCNCKSLYYALPAPLKAAIRFPVWWWTIRRYLPRTHIQRPSAEHPATIVTYFPNIDTKAAESGRFRSRYWENLHDVLNAAGKKINWLFIHFPAPQYSFPETVHLRDRFRANGQDGVSFHFLEEFLNTADLVHALWRYIRLLVASLRLEKEVRLLFHFAGSKMPLWLFLKENWTDSMRGWRALERCLMAKAFRRYIAWAGQQDWFTFPQENCPWERMLAQAAHEANAGPVYGAQHSTVRFSDFRYFDDPRLVADQSCRLAMPDVWLCNGSGAAKALIDSGLPEKRIRLVEALRYLYLATPRTEVPAAEKRILVVTSFFDDETEAHLAFLARAVQAGLLDTWHLLVKPHPWLPVRKKLQQLFHGQIPQIVDGAIGTFLVPGTVVWASNSTTVALEAAWYGLPVLVQAPENDFSLCPIQNIPGVITIRNLADVQAALAHPLQPKLPADYLLLDKNLPRWRKILNLDES